MSASPRHNVTGVWFGNDDFTAMNKMTGGLLPAPTWKKHHAGGGSRADAGRPRRHSLDDSYTPVTVAAVADATATSDETDQPVSDGELPASQSGDVSVVLNDMFNLFEQPSAKPKIKTQTQAQAQQKPKQQALILPQANAKTDAVKKRNFLDKLFGSSGEKSKPRKKKKKPIFGIF